MPDLAQKLVLGLLGGRAAAITFDSYMATLSPAPKFWFEGDKITGATDNNPLDTWQEHSGNAALGNATGAAGARPTYFANILNGLPVGRFDGVANKLSTPVVAPGVVTGVNAATVFLVIKQVASQVSNAAFSWVTAPTNQFDGLVSFGDTLYWDHGATAGAGRISVAQPVGWDDAWHLVKFTLGGGVGTITVDGVQLKSAAMSSTMNSGTSAFVLGASTTVFFKGDIYLVLGWDVLLDVAVQNQITNLLATKTGLLVSAP